LLDHHLHQMVFEKLAADDYRRKFDPRLESLNELPDPSIKTGLMSRGPCGSFVVGTRSKTQSIVRFVDASSITDKAGGRGELMILARVS